mmetsp:Transcript_77512/g.179677  ORF Transcript_77512/g.179677 Transcript_77512/m.179677 type:complete len:215 (-) Transcript_77512:143-787(-)
MRPECSDTRCCSVYSCNAAMRSFTMPAASRSCLSSAEWSARWRTTKAALFCTWSSCGSSRMARTISSKPPLATMRCRPSDDCAAGWKKAPRTSSRTRGDALCAFITFTPSSMPSACTKRTTFWGSGKPAAKPHQSWNMSSGLHPSSSCRRTALSNTSMPPHSRNLRLHSVLKSQKQPMNEPCAAIDGSSGYLRIAAMASSTPPALVTASPPGAS